MLSIFAAALMLAYGPSVHAQAVTNAFTYQGELRSAGSPASGNFDMQFALFGSLSGGAQIGATLGIAGVPVSSGLFNVQLDFGPTQFAGDRQFLEVRVRAAGAPNFEILLPRTEVTATPYAIAAKVALPNSVTTTSIVDGTIGSADVNSSQIQRRVSGACAVGQYVRAVAADGTVTCGVDDGGTPGWSLSGNAGTTPATQFLGTTDGQPLRLQSTAGVGINTGAVRGALTIRGADDPQSGPMLMIHGLAGGQTEAGRIRFGDDATPNNYAGFYIHHDSAANLLHIGSHSVNGTLTTDDLPRITLQRDNPRRVGIGTTTPTQALDVAGTIAATGATSDVRAERDVRAGRDVVIEGVARFPGRSNVVTLFTTEATENEQEEDCFDGSFGKRRRSILSGECFATGWPSVPSDVRVTQLRGGFFDEDSGSNCSMTLVRYVQNTTSAPSTLLTGLNSSISGGFQLVTASVNHTFAPGTRMAVRVRSNSEDCTPMWIEITYDTPNGWTP